MIRSFSIFLVAISCYSCENNKGALPNPEVIDSTISIEDAKIWFDKTLKNSEISARKSGIEREFLWDFANHMKNKKKREGVLVPMRFKDKTRLALTVQDTEATGTLWIEEKALIFKDKKGKPTIYILQFAKLNPNALSFGLSDFNGWITCATFEGELLWGQKWKNGKILNKYTVVGTNAKVNCSIIDVGYDSYGSQLVEIDGEEKWEFYVTHHRNYTWVDCFGGGGSGSGNGDNGGGGGGAGNTGESDQNDNLGPEDYIEEEVMVFIKNMLIKPCFKNAFNLIKLNSQSLNKVQSIFNNYNVSYINNFVIDEFYDASPEYATVPGKHINGTIYLNKYTMQFSSLEMIVATIFHEMLHIEILTLGSSDHITMSLYYVQPWAEALRSMFPNLYPDDAMALAWGGLQTTSAWQQIDVNERQLILNRFYKYWNYQNSNNQQYGIPCSD